MLSYSPYYLLHLPPECPNLLPWKRLSCLAQRRDAHAFRAHHLLLRIAAFALLGFFRIALSPTKAIARVSLLSDAVADFLTGELHVRPQ